VLLLRNKFLWFSFEYIKHVDSLLPLTAQISGTAELAVAFATAKWHANFAVSTAFALLGILY